MELIRAYNITDYETVNKWFTDQRVYSIPADFLSDIGYIVPGVAVGFLVKTNINCCFLEPFIANPDAPVSIRDEALREILRKLEDTAKSMGIRMVYGIATSPTMINRALDSGWVDLGKSTLLTKETT